MNTEFFNALDLLEKEKGIPKEYMFEKVEAALVTAFKKEKGNNSMVRIVLDPNKKDVRVYEQWNIVEEVTDPQTEISLEDAKKMNRRYVLGGVAEAELKTKTFGRISAQTAKQVIIQGIRESERGMAYNEYSSREHEILNATVFRVDPESGTIIVEVVSEGEKIETALAKGEQVPGEVLTEGQRIKVYVVEVRKGMHGPQILLSRTHPGLVKRLFELEVPEIHDGVVEIKSIAREAGNRTKIAVMTHDEKVDPIGACVGPRGSRVGSIVNELSGEKIDIIKYSENMADFVSAALSPADVISAVMLPDGKSCRVTVPDDQLSLAIGKEGQNARLAAKLTGCKIDIGSESAAKEQAEQADEDLLVEE